MNPIKSVPWRRWKYWHSRRGEEGIKEHRPFWGVGVTRNITEETYSSNKHGIQGTIFQTLLPFWALSRRVQKLFYVKNKEAAEELSLLPPSSHNKKWLREKEGENWYCVVPGNRVRVRVGKSERTDFSIPILRCNLYLDLSSRGMNGLMNSMALGFPWGTTDILLCWRVKLAPISGSWCWLYFKLIGRNFFKLKIPGPYTY